MLYLFFLTVVFSPCKCCEARITVVLKSIYNKVKPTS